MFSVKVSAQRLISDNPGKKTKISPGHSWWFISFLKYDPQKYWKKIKIRTLALNGDLDIQVNAKVNLTAIENLENKHIKTRILKNHNHLFQIAKTGSLQEYYKLNEGISKETLLEIKNFIIEKQIR